jgi:Trk-type K+ transport system membrane component
MARQELMHKFTAKLVRSESLGQVIVPANVQQESTTQKFIRIYGKSIFVRDITWVFLAITIILFIEGSRIQAYPQDYSVFYVFFEVVSAYGTVGQSLSETNSYNGWSKLVIIFIMLLGRHRGLPSKNDPAVVPEHYQSLRKLRAKKRDEFEDLVETDSFGSQQPQRKDSTTVQ